MITLTELAKTKLKEFSDDEGIGHYSVRVKILGGGCAGFSYDMTFDNAPTEMDEVLEFEDEIKVIVDPISLQYLENVEIDFLDTMIGGGFKFNNPDVTSSCGCGNSVSF